MTQLPNDREIDAGGNYHEDNREIKGSGDTIEEIRRDYRKTHIQGQEINNVEGNYYNINIDGLLSMLIESQQLQNYQMDAVQSQSQAQKQALRELDNIGLGIASTYPKSFKVISSDSGIPKIVRESSFNSSSDSISTTS